MRFSGFSGPFFGNISFINVSLLRLHSFLSFCVLRSSHNEDFSSQTNNNNKIFPKKKFPKNFKYFFRFFFCLSKDFQKTKNNKIIKIVVVALEQK